MVTQDTLLIYAPNIFIYSGADLGAGNAVKHQATTTNSEVIWHRAIEHLHKLRFHAKLQWWSS